MAHAYTPGLKVTEKTVLLKHRILPVPGDVLVSEGHRVAPDDIVARAELPGEVVPMNAAGLLGVPPEDVPGCMLKKEGDAVEENEIIGRSAGFFGLFKTELRAKISGKLESVSRITGQLMLRGAPIPVQVKAYVSGRVVKVLPRQGVEIETRASLIQGIFGVGGETHGMIRTATSSRREPLEEKHFLPEDKGKVVVGGSLVTAGALKKAIQVGARAVVAGGIEAEDLRQFMGYDLGVAITGSEDLGLSVVVTEGFGTIEMAEKTWNLLKSKEGREASLNGATQIRAGVIRPEILVPLEEGKDVGIEAVVSSHGLEVGSVIRVIRDPYFGKLGKVTDLPSALQALDTGSRARVLEVEFETGGRAVVPRANVEILEG